jgi:hypothetical protein
LAIEAGHDLDEIVSGREAAINQIGTACRLNRQADLVDRLAATLGRHDNLGNAAGRRCRSGRCFGRRLFSFLAKT